MSEKFHFNESERVELARIFSDLADFVHREGITQVIGDGPSASPFVNAFRLAYRKRHDGHLQVVNLGEVGERLMQFSFPDARDNARLFLDHFRPSINRKVKSLLLTEASLVGVKFSSTSKALAETGVEHKTAAIIRIPISRSQDAFFRPDFVGRNLTKEEANADYLASVYPQRGLALSKDSSISLIGTHVQERHRKRQTIANLKSLRKELHEIANSVPKK